MYDLRLTDEIISAKYISRPNRFIAIVDFNGMQEMVHVPNPGRMKELLIPGVKIFLRRVINPNRKTCYDLIGLIHDGVHISLDSNAPNKIFKEGILKGKIREFGNILHFRPEIKYGNSRLDFLLTSNIEKIYVEIKSCTLVENGIALFPDAPTLRGVRHLKELEKIVMIGNRAAIFFIIQRNDAAIFMPNDKTDPLFGETLRKVSLNGVEIYAYKCKVMLPEIEIFGPVKVSL